MSTPVSPSVGSIAEPMSPEQLTQLVGTLEGLAELGVYVWAPASGVVSWSPGFYRLLGLPVAPIEAVRFFDHVHPDDRARVMMSWELAATQGRFAPDPYRLIGPGGAVRWVIGRGLIERGADGALLRIVGTLLDVTLAHEAADRLADAHAILAETQRAAGVGTFVFHIATGKLEWSEQIYRFLGASPEQPPAGELVRALVGDDEDARYRAWRERVIAGETLPPRRVRIPRPDGTVVIVETIARRLDRPSGPCVVGVAIDVTARAELEEQVRHASTMDAIGTLAAGIAHDFNNYLTVLSVQVEAMRAGRRAASASDLASMAEAIDRSSALVRQLLAFARRHPYHPEKLDLTAQVDGVVRLFTRVSGPAIEVRWAGAPPLAIEGDAAQLDGAIMNLLVNARDAMPGGGVVTVTLEAMGDQVRLRVHDTGDGIAPDVLPRIFEPYFTTKAAGAGVGLGLAAVYGTVQQHGGKIEVTSAPGAGSSFDVFLPLVRHDPIAAATAQATAASPTLRILLVEDLDLLRAALAALLEDEGHEVTAVGDGEQALARLAAGGRFDVVVSDVVMPKLDGHGLVRALATVAPSLPVILMSGYTDERETAGPTWLDKPFSRDELRAALNAVRAK